MTTEKFEQIIQARNAKIAAAKAKIESEKVRRKMPAQVITIDTMNMPPDQQAATEVVVEEVVNDAPFRETTTVRHYRYSIVIESKEDIHDKLLEKLGEAGLGCDRVIYYSRLGSVNPSIL